MPVAPGTYEIGPSSGRLLLRTFRQGVAARAGHDLVIEARVWNGEVRVPDAPGEQPSISAEIDLRELHVVEGTGGVKPLSENDKADIRRAMQKPLHLDAHPVARFSSTQVLVEGDRATIEGVLELAGSSEPLRLEAAEAPEGRITAMATIAQTKWGIKPYSGFLGALKLRDEVELEVAVDLTGA